MPHLAQLMSYNIYDGDEEDGSLRNELALGDD